MLATTTVGDHLAERLGCARREPLPFDHWLLTETLPPATAAALVALPMAPPPIGDTNGKRETHNATRVFLSPEMRWGQPVCDSIAAAFQDKAITSLLQRLCRVDLGGSYLRIEYCLDSAGFWLEPHTDIGAKLFTCLIYLSDAPDATDWGTDLYDRDKRHVGRAPADFDNGLIFIPGTDTWHGFEPRVIAGVRRSLIVNFVKDEWRARHELAYPDAPVA